MTRRECCAPVGFWPRSRSGCRDRGLAQDYPSRPMNIIIPFTAGGPTDTAARTFLEVLRRHLGQPLVAENRPAASGVPGTEAGRSASPTAIRCCWRIAALMLVPPI